MKAVVQRVSSASVGVNGNVISSIGNGLLVLIGIEQGDRLSDAAYLAEKIANLRIFEDNNGKMNRSLLETGGQMLVVSQFTLLGDCRKGRRPSFVKAAPPDIADRLYEYFSDQVSKKGIDVQTGRFKAMMKVSLVNDGPVTLILESPKGP
jgi:D-tyrosyl-tRNA(Tyr) deacylase